MKTFLWRAVRLPFVLVLFLTLFLVRYVVTLIASVLSCVILCDSLPIVAALRSAGHIARQAMHCFTHWLPWVRFIATSREVWALMVLISKLPYKVHKVNPDGTEEILMRTNADGTKEPVTRTLLHSMLEVFAWNTLAAVCEIAFVILIGLATKVAVDAVIAVLQGTQLGFWYYTISLSCIFAGCFAVRFSPSLAKYYVDINTQKFKNRMSKVIDNLAMKAHSSRLILTLASAGIGQMVYRGRDIGADMLGEILLRYPAKVLVALCSVLVTIYLSPIVGILMAIAIISAAAFRFMADGKIHDKADRLQQVRKNYLGLLSRHFSTKTEYFYAKPWDLYHLRHRTVVQSLIKLRELEMCQNEYFRLKFEIRKEQAWFYDILADLAFSFFLSLAFTVEIYLMMLGIQSMGYGSAILALIPYVAIGMQLFGDALAQYTPERGNMGMALEACHLEEQLGLENPIDKFNDIDEENDPQE